MIRLNEQYSSIVRTSLSVHARLMRAQAVRQKDKHFGVARSGASRGAGGFWGPKNGENVSEGGTNSHNTAFETQMSATNWTHLLRETPFEPREIPRLP